MKQKTLTTEGFKMIHEIFRLRWIPEIIATIGTGHHGYNEILGQIDYLSNTELNRKLKVLLERNVIVKKDDVSHAGYFLTPFGDDLNHIFKHFTDRKSVV